MSSVKGQAKVVEPQQSIPGLDGMQDDLSSLVVGLMDQNAELLNKLERMESLVHKSREKAKVEAERINSKALERAERIITRAKEKAGESAQKKISVAEKRAQTIIRVAEEEASRIIVAAEMIAEEEALPVIQEAEQLSTPGSEIAETLTAHDLEADQQKGVKKEESPAALQQSTVGFSINFPRATEQLLKMSSRLKSLLKSKSWN